MRPTGKPPVVLDEGALGQLRELGARCGEDMIAKLHDLFLELLPGRVAQLREAVEQGDAERVRREAHTLKGSAATLGGARVASCCQELEDVAKSCVTEEAPGLAGAGQLLERLEQELEDFNRAVHEQRTG